MHLIRPCALLLALATSACAAPPSPSTAATTTRVFKPLGSLQCSGGGQTAAALAQTLVAAGVPVRSTRCGSDGRMYAAMCGAADGRIGIFEIAATHGDAAAKLGFRTLGPDAQEQPCR